VVITGCGCISPLGNSAAAIRAWVLAGRTGFSSRMREPEVADLAGMAVSPVPDFDCAAYAGRWKHLRYLARGARFALAAAVQALRDAGYADGVLPVSAGAGCYLGMGPNLDITADFPLGSAREQAERNGGVVPGGLDHDGLQALWLLRYLPNSAASAIARRCGLHGENATLGTACAASLMAVGTAYRAIRHGVQPMALAGGGDSRLNPGGLLGYAKAGALCRSEEFVSTPEAASRPFDAGRCGFVPGEGGAVFVLESLEHAVARKARILAEVRGYGNTMDGHAMTAPDPEGVQTERAVRSALSEAHCRPEEVSVVSAHGTSTILNDAMEAALLDRVFGSGPHVLALKSWLGHGAAACGALELAVCLATLRHGMLPAVRNLQAPIAPLRFAGPAAQDCSECSVRAAHTVHTVLLQNFGFGGQNAALVVDMWPEEA